MLATVLELVTKDLLAKSLSAMHLLDAEPENV